MARDHARILVSIWNDDDFNNLTVSAQHLYLALATHPKLSYCGVVDWWPGRLAKLAKGMTENDVYAAVSELMDARFVWLDMDTSELLVRSYVRYDGVMNRPNMGKAVATALGFVTSKDVRGLIQQELGRLRQEQPALGGWTGLREKDSKVYEQVISIACAIGKGSDEKSIA